VSFTRHQVRSLSLAAVAMGSLVAGALSHTAPPADSDPGVPGIDTVVAAMDPNAETHASARMGSHLFDLIYAVPDGIATGRRPIRGFPTAGEWYAVLSTGVASQAVAQADPSVTLSSDIHSAPLEPFFPTDETRIRLTLAPPPGRECLAVDVLFGTEEHVFGDIGVGVDYFTIESPTFDDDESKDADPPNNFARTPDGGVVRVGSGVPFSAEPDWALDGWTKPYTAHIPLRGGSWDGPGYTDVVISVLDIGDSYRDSVLLVDNLRFEDATGCPGNGILTPIPQPDPIVVGTVPIVSGAARVGSRLTAAAGFWSPQGTVLYYQWLRNGVPIDGATAHVYTLRLSDVLSRISVRVTGAYTGADSVVYTSPPTPRVRLH
jgi:hypothetical protein